MSATLVTDILTTHDGVSKDIKSLIGPETLVSRVNFASDAAFNAAKVGKLSVDGTGRLRANSIVIGQQELTSPTTRDGFVSGVIVEGPTDRHDFNAASIYRNITDYGGCAAYDCNIRIEGPHNHNHAAYGQDRINYAGSGTLEHMWGFLSAPLHSGTGTILSRMANDIQDVYISAGGVLSENIGINIRNLTSGTNNAAINLAQTTGFAISARGGAQSYHAGPIAIGTSSDTNGQYLSIKGSTTGPTLFASSTLTAGQTGVLSDHSYQVIAGGVVCVEVAPVSGQHAFRPGTTGVQPLGDASRLWASVWSSTGAISTSDARLKTAVRKFNEAEIKAADELADELGAYKFLASIAEKGDEAREHIGMTVQRAIEIMEANGLDPFGYSFICYDKWDKQTVNHPDQVIEHPEVMRPSALTDDRGQPFMVKVSDAWTELVKPAWTETIQEAGDLFSFRESGLHSFIMAGAKARAAALKVQVDELTERLSALEA